MPDSLPTPPGSRPRGLMRVLGGLALFALAQSVTAIPITIDTSSRETQSATLSIALFDGDFTANNQATISNLMTDGTLGLADCSVGCTDLPPITLDDTNSFGQFLQLLTLGTFISFDLTFTNLFDNTPDGTSDLIIGELLDDPGFALFDTNLDDPLAPVPYENALFVANLADNRVFGATNLTTVPEPASLALMVSGLALLCTRRAGGLFKSRMRVSR